MITKQLSTARHNAIVCDMQRGSKLPVTKWIKNILLDITDGQLLDYAVRWVGKATPYAINMHKSQLK